MNPSPTRNYHERQVNAMTQHSTMAKELFKSGYNCAQAVLCAFEDVTGLDRDVALRLASSFGGGLARMREVCGAVSGAAMVLGLVYGSTDPTDHAAKKEHYHRVQEFARRFRELNGSIICRELLAGAGTPGGDPEQRTAEYYQKRPCAELVAQAAEILDQLFRE